MYPNESINVIRTGDDNVTGGRVPDSPRPGRLGRILDIGLGIGVTVVLAAMIGGVLAGADWSAWRVGRSPRQGRYDHGTSSATRPSDGRP